ncbi:MAG: SIMPL domain-containing protein [Chloroflexi bacterium]|nr:SIMPL domain-containing protein [Chloroflexota bacterium]
MAYFTNRAFHARFALLLCALLAALIPIAPVAAQGSSSYTITVRGVGSASARPDLVSCEAGVEVVHSDAITAYSNVNTRLETIRAGLVALGIRSSDIQLLRVIIIPEDRTDSGVAPTGEFLYRARGTLQVLVRSPQSLDNVLSAAVQSGAHSIENFTFGFENTERIEQAARDAAIENAYARAEQLAESMGVAVGDPIIIAEELVDLTIDGTPFTAAPNMTVSPYPIQAGEVTFRVEVAITFALRSAMTPRPERSDDLLPEAEESDEAD